MSSGRRGEYFVVLTNTQESAVPLMNWTVRLVEVSTVL